MVWETSLVPGLKHDKTIIRECVKDVELKGLFVLLGVKFRGLLEKENPAAKKKLIRIAEDRYSGKPEYKRKVVDKLHTDDKLKRALENIWGNLPND